MNLLYTQIRVISHTRREVKMFLKVLDFIVYAFDVISSHLTPFEEVFRIEILSKGLGKTPNEG